MYLTGTANLTTPTATLTVSSTAGLAVGETVTGAGIPVARPSPPSTDLRSRSARRRRRESPAVNRSLLAPRPASRLPRRTARRRSRFPALQRGWLCRRNRDWRRHPQRHDHQQHYERHDAGAQPVAVRDDSSGEEIAFGSPFNLAATAATSTTTLTVPSTSGLVVGENVTGVAFPAARPSAPFSTERHSRSARRRRCRSPAMKRSLLAARSTSRRLTRGRWREPLPPAR
jgi:hypothetical protein